MRKESSRLPCRTRTRGTCHSGFQVVPVPGVFPAGGHHHHLVSCLDLGRHLGQLELDRLVLGDRLAEGMPPLRVVDGQLEGAQRQPAAAAATLTGRLRRRPSSGKALPVSPPSTRERECGRLGGSARWCRPLVAIFSIFGGTSARHRRLGRSPAPSRSGRWSCSGAERRAPHRSGRAPPPGWTSRRWSATSSGR